MKKYIAVVFILFCIQLCKAQEKSKASSIFYEKAYLHTDRTDYSAGDELWFKAYLLNAQSNLLSSSSENLYVELINPDEEIIGKKTIYLNKGLGNGDFKLNDSLPTGRYLIRAYTNWMKNFGELFIFTKEINIYQPVLKADLAKRKADKINKTPLNQSIELKENIQLFPESGDLIEGVAGMVAFKAVDGFGRGISVKGQLISNDGEINNSFESSHLGMGSFLLNPKPGILYTIKGIYANGKPFLFALPKALSKGFSFHVQQTDSLTRIIVSTNLASLNEWQGREFTLLAKSHSKVFYGAKFNLNQLRTVINLDQKTLTAGISTFTIYDLLNTPYAERLIYTQGDEKVRIALTTDKKVYLPKEKTTVNIKLTDQDQQPLKANLSLSAIDQSLNSVPTESMASYLLLQSEIIGEIEQPEYYFNKNNPDRLAHIDLLLLTQGWRDFLWKRLAETKTVLSYMPEKGFSITGNVRQVWADKPIEKANITLSVPGAIGDKLFAQQTDSKGKYFFDGLKFYGDQKLSITTRDLKGKKDGWILMDSIYPEAPKLIFKPLSLQDENPKEWDNITQAIANRKELKRKISLADTIQLKEVTVIDPKQYLNLTSPGYPDEIFNITPKDYEFENLRQYILTNAKGTFLDTDITRNGVLFRSGNKWIDPIIIADQNDIPAYDSSQLMKDNYYEIPINMIKKIVVRHLIGNAAVKFFQARDLAVPLPPPEDIYIIFLTLKPDALLKKDLDVIHSLVSGYSEPKVFYTPNYTKKTKVTDLRNTIHWEPNITTNEKGEATISFYNADPETKIRVMLEGISETGIPITGTLVYEVKNK